jgi:hypothetical protein
MFQLYKQFNDYLEKMLHEKGRIADMSEKIEKVTGVKRIYIAQGLYLIIN